jgi:hypothetical protein
LTADLTRTPAKDRLLEDFERRFESSLARAAGANGQSPLNALSPLASAGLPAGMQAPGSTLPLAQATVSTPIGHPAFAADLSHRVLLFAGQRVTQRADHRDPQRSRSDQRVDRDDTGRRRRSSSPPPMPPPAPPSKMRCRACARCSPRRGCS